jgi:hypothetical protein
MKTWLILLLIPVAALASDTFTDRVYSQLDVIREIASATDGGGRVAAGPYSYAQVRRDALVEVNAVSLYKVSKHYGVGASRMLGRTGYNKRFDCEAFAIAFVLELRARLQAELFHSRSEVNRPACIYVGFIKDSDGRGHGILLIFTDQGTVFWDPIAGEVNLSAREIKSLYQPAI